MYIRLVRKELLIAMACLFTSCGYRIRPHAGQLPISKNNREMLNGYYYNLPSSEEARGVTLWKMLKHENGQPGGNKVCVIAGPKTLSAILYDNEYAIDSIRLKGKFKKGYFLSKRTKARGVPFIIYAGSQTIVQLGKDTSGSLLTDIQRSNYGNVVIISAGSTSHDFGAYHSSR